MNEHIDKVHPGVVHKTVTTSYTNKYQKELEEMCVKCFGHEYKPRKVSRKEKWKKEEDAEHPFLLSFLKLNA
jgi:hypothetical protein